MNAEKAKKVPIGLVLEKIGCPPPVERQDGRWFLSPFRNEKHPSLKVYEDVNTFNDFGSHHQGNVLELVMQKYQLDVSQALKQFEEWARGDSRFITHGGVSYIPKKTDRQSNLSKAGGEGSQEVKEPLIEIYNLKELENEVLVDYLESRKINVEIAKLYLQEAYFLAGKDKKQIFALAFENSSGAYELRNPGYKGANSPKDVSLWVNSDGIPLLMKKRKSWVEWQRGNPENGKSVLVFEGFMDLLSANTYKNKPVFDTPAMVTNSSSMTKGAISLLQSYEFEKIYYFGDNDEAGDLALKAFRENLEGVEIQDARGLYKGFKDFNEFLVAMHKVNEFFGLNKFFVNAGDNETDNYLYWLLSECSEEGINPEDIFSKEAMELISQNATTHSQVNNLAQKALIESWRRKKKPVGDGTVEKLIGDK